MAWFGGCLDGLRATWPVKYCLAKEEEAGARAGNWPPLQEKPIFIQQPSLLPSPSLPPKLPRVVSQHQSQPARPNTEAWTLISRASSAASRVAGKPKPRRPTIGVPTDFRRVEPSSDFQKAYRPLQLSIYVPGNELRPLPVFSPTSAVPDTRKLTAPAQAHILRKTASDTILLRRSSSPLEAAREPLTISTQPLLQVPFSNRISTVDSIYSIQSDVSLSPSTLERSHSIYLEAINKLPTSTQNFLSLLEDRPKPPAPLRLRSRARSTSPGSNVVRRKASDQNIRLRTHLEERQEMESRLQDFDTIMEEWTNSSSAPSPIPDSRQPSALFGAENGAILETMRQTLDARSNSWAETHPVTYQSHLQYAHVLPTTPPLPTPALLRKPGIRSFHLRSLGPPLPPPSSPPPANPAQRQPQQDSKPEYSPQQVSDPRYNSQVSNPRYSPPQWYRPDSYDLKQSFSQNPNKTLQFPPRPQRSSASSGTLTEELDCPSLGTGSAVSTPGSSPRRPQREHLPSLEYVVDGVEGPVKIEWGVAF